VIAKIYASRGQGKKERVEDKERRSVVESERVVKGEKGCKGRRIGRAQLEMGKRGNGGEEKGTVKGEVRGKRGVS